LEELPEYRTQGENPAEPEENVKDFYKYVTAGNIPFAYGAGNSSSSETRIPDLPDRSERVRIDLTWKASRLASESHKKKRHNPYRDVMKLLTVWSATLCKSEHESFVMVLFPGRPAGRCRRLFAE
jgi:hypothetical protein